MQDDLPVKTERQCVVVAWFSVPVVRDAGHDRHAAALVRTALARWLHEQGPDARFSLIHAVPVESLPPGVPGPAAREHVSVE